DGKVGGLVSPCGLFLFHSAHDIHFLTLVLGQSVAWLPPEKPNYWLVDGVLLETVVVPTREIGGQPGTADRDVVRRHREWELRRAADQQHTNPIDATEVESRDATPPNLARSVWTFELRSPVEVLGHRVTRLSYATVALPGWIFVMSAPVRPDDDVEKVHRVL